MGSIVRHHELGDIDIDIDIDIKRIQDKRTLPVSAS